MHPLKLITALTTSVFLSLILISPSFGQAAKLKKIQRIMDKATSDNLNGVVVFIQSPEYGPWIGASGLSDVVNKTPMKADDIFGLASIGKTYTATAVLKLVEEGKLKLDDRIAQYLPDEIIEHVSYADEVTIRQLLGHTSGFYNYNRDPELNKMYLEGHLSLDTVTHMDILRKYFYHKPETNKPGERYRYSSTNYLLLSMIMDQVLDQGHEAYMRSMLEDLNLTNTYYKETPPSLVHHYGDLNQDGVSEDLTRQTIETTNWYSGDDGVYAPISEAAQFLELLLSGDIINEDLLQEMMSWNDERDPDYGLGLEADRAFPYGLIMGHSGSGIGMRTDLYYMPKKDMIVGIFSNTGLRSASPSFAKTYYKMRTNIILKLFLL